MKFAWGYRVNLITVPDKRPHRKYLKCHIPLPLMIYFPRTNALSEYFNISDQVGESERYFSTNEQDCQWSKKHFYYEIQFLMYRSIWCQFAWETCRGLFTGSRREKLLVPSPPLPSSSSQWLDWLYAWWKSRRKCSSERDKSLNKLDKQSWLCWISTSLRLAF